MNDLPFGLSVTLFRQINRLRGDRSWRKFFIDYGLIKINQSNIRSTNPSMCMTFEFAMLYAKMRLKVRRLEWDRKSRVFYNRNGLNVEKITKCGTFHTLSEYDIAADDWVVI